MLTPTADLWAGIITIVFGIPWTLWLLQDYHRQEK